MVILSAGTPLLHYSIVILSGAWAAAHAESKDLLVLAAERTTPDHHTPAAAAAGCSIAWNPTSFIAFWASRPFMKYSQMNCVR